MTTASFTYKPVDINNWSDLETLFESKGCPHHCWCMVWRKMNNNTKRSDKKAKKAYMKSYIDKNIPVGLLCYSGSEPVAWCSIQPRESYRELSGDNSLNNVWSLVCFFIKQDFRRMGLSEKLISEALKYAKKNGAKYVEAYPVDKESPGYRFMGFKTSFEKKGFSFKHMAGTRRNVMTIDL